MNPRVKQMQTKDRFGKLHKYRFMKLYKGIRTHLPDTRLATKANLSSMLKSYRSIFLKPDNGTGGHGIYKISRTKAAYVIKSGTVTKHYPSFDALYKTVHTLLLKKRYVLQKGIQLLRHRKRPFDIRVMVQKNKSKRFVVTGVIGRLAKPGKIVTNYHSGGTPLPVNILLKSHVKGSDRASYSKSIERLGKRASIVMGKQYRTRNAFGVDIAIDPEMKLWILEVNTKPDKYIFNTLKDKTMYRRILKYEKIKG